METNICREKHPQGCSELIPAIPCKYFVMRGGEKVYIDVDASKYKVIGSNKDVYFLTIK